MVCKWQPIDVVDVTGKKNRVRSVLFDNLRDYTGSSDIAELLYSKKFDFTAWAVGKNIQLDRNLEPQIRDYIDYIKSSNYGYNSLFIDKYI